jgi:membrane protein
LFGARSAAGGVIDALNIAYEEKNRRGFVRRTFLAIAITAASIFFAISAAIAAAAIGHISDIAFLPSGIASFAAQCLTQVFLAAVGAVVAATLYRFGPEHRNGGWQWLTPGSLFSALGWVFLTLGFKAYAANFGRYDVTYGSLSTVVVLLTWLYLSSFVFLFGAELNSELEKVSEGERS